MPACVRASVCLSVWMLLNWKDGHARTAAVPEFPQSAATPPLHPHGGKNKPQQTAPSACLEVAAARLCPSHLAVTFSVAVLIARLYAGEKEQADFVKKTKNGANVPPSSPSPPSPQPPARLSSIIEMFSQRTQDTRFSLGRQSLCEVATKLLKPQPRHKHKRGCPFFLIFFLESVILSCEHTIPITLPSPKPSLTSTSTKDVRPIRAATRQPEKLHEHTRSLFSGPPPGERLLQHKVQPQPTV